MSTYVKFLKDSLRKKRKYIEEDNINIQGTYSAIMQQTLPRNSKTLVALIFLAQLKIWLLGWHCLTWELALI